MATLTPVDIDPFAAEQPQSPPLTPGVARVQIGGREQPQSELKLTPVDHDPFAKTVGDKAEGLYNGFDAGAARMVAATGGAVGDAMDLIGAGMSKGRNSFERYMGQPESPPLDRSQTIFSVIPTSADMKKTIQHDFYNDAPEYQPQNKQEEYARTAGEFLLNGVGGAGRRILQRAGQVLLPAATSETAGQITKGTAAEPYARFAGALTGAGFMALLGRPGTTAAAIKQQLPEGLTPQIIDQAEALMTRARQQGVDLAWPEALSQVGGRPVLTNMMRHLEASPQTEAQMAEFFAQRPQQVENAARQQFDNIAPVNNAPSTIGPAVGQAAEGTINDVRGAINKAAEPLYTASSTRRLPPQEMARVTAHPGWAEARAAVRNDPQLNRYVANLPDDSVGFLNEVKKYLDTAAENAAAPINQQRNMQRAAGYGTDAKAIKNAAVNADPTYGAALAVESVGREKYLQPLLDGPLGKIAQKDIGTQKAIDALFPKNPLPNSEHEISVAVSALAKRNQRAAGDLVRAHAESTFNQAAKDLQTGANQAGGAKFRAALVGNPQQKANLQAAVEALPNGSERWKGFNNFLEVLEATGTRQGIGSRTSYNTELLKNSGNGGLVSDAVKTGANPTRVGQKFIDRYERYKLGKDLGQLADVLTDPRSADLLRSIAKVEPGSEKAKILALRLVTYVDSSRASRAPIEKSGQ